MRRTILVSIIIALCIPLYSLPVSFETALGHRNSSIADSPVFFSAKGGIGPASLYFQTDDGQIFDFVLDLGFEQGKTLEHHLNSSLQLIPDNGGFTTLSYLFTQDLRWRWGHFRYGIGVQLGYAWSLYSAKPAYSISPMGEVTLGFDAGGFSSDIFLTTYADEERSWKETPVIGTRLEYDFDEHLSFYTSAYVEIAELFMQPYILISAYGGKAGFVFRGNT